MSLILDSSVTLAWVYSDETTESIRRVFDMVTNNGAWVPALWRLDIANILEMGVRRGRTSAQAWASSWMKQCWKPAPVRKQA